MKSKAPAGIKTNLRTSGRLIDFTPRLLAWFRENRREMPWRKTRSPYRTWISEIMLQQTVVAAVVPRFEAWIEQYPNPRALARAKEQDVLRAWEGLGYYSRARNILRAAKLITAKHGGEVPRSREALRALPGIGDYTASAILSIAFGQSAPVLDANVRRVMSRILCIESWTTSAEKLVRATLADLIPDKRPGDFNEAMMELGATVCRSAHPACHACPVVLHCEARRRGLESVIPARRKTTVIRRSTPLAVIIEGDRVLVRKRGADEIGAGLWGFPEIEKTPLRAGAFVSAKCDRRLEALASLPRVIHSYTKFRDELRPWLFRTSGRVRSGRSRACPDEKWLTWDEVAAIPFPSVYRRIIAAARNKVFSPP